MKKATITFAILFGVFAVLFGISIAATGISNNPMSFGWVFGDGRGINNTGETSIELDDKYNNIEISNTSCNVKLSVSDTDKTEISYSGKPKQKDFEVYIKNDCLYVVESFRFTLFYINFTTNDNVLTISLPEKDYEKITYNNVSGDADLSGLKGESLTINNTSGKLDLNVYADKINISTISGDINLTNCTDKKCDVLALNSTSGNFKLKGFSPDEYTISSISGDYNIEDLSGKGDINITSGHLRLSYAEWNDDVTISLISGGVDMILPENSGVIASVSAISGNVDIDLDGDRISVDDGSTDTVGGDNVHNVEASLTSGNVNITN